MRCCQTIQIFALSIAGIMDAVSSNFFKKTRFYHNILKLSRSGSQNPDSKFLIEALNAKALCAFGNICKFWLWVMKTSLLSPRLLITCLRTEQNNESDKLFWWPRWPWMSDDRWEVRETKKELCGTSRREVTFPPVQCFVRPFLLRTDLYRKTRNRGSPWLLVSM